MKPSDALGADPQMNHEGDASPSLVPASGATEAPTVMPFSSGFSFLRQHSSLHPLVNDERAVSRLLETLLQKAGLTIGQAAKVFGVRDEAIRQYVTGRRTNPSLKWFLHFAQLCGAKVTIEFPK